MKSLVASSVLFAVVAACSGPKKPDNSVPVGEQPLPPPSSQVTADAGATVPSPPSPEGEAPSDTPQGNVRRAESAQVAQATPDAGIGGMPVRDAGAPGGVDAGARVPARDAGAPGDAGAARDAGAPGRMPGDAGPR
jgi:hypothetical protein